MTQNDFYTRLDEYMDSGVTFDLIPPLVAQAHDDGLSILVAFQKNEKDESVAAYGMLQGRMFLPIMSSKKFDRIEVFSLVVQVHMSHKPWISKYQVRE